MLSDSLSTLTQARTVVVAVVALFIVLAGTGVGFFAGSVPLGQDQLSAGTDGVQEAPQPPIPPTAPEPATGQSSAAADPTQPTSRTTTSEPTCDCLDVAFTPTDPDDVANTEGIVPALAGELAGLVEWDAPAERVTLVVHTWTPNEEWTERKRTTVEPSDERSLTLAQAFDSTQLFYSDTTPGFANPADASTRTGRGYVSVTAVLYEGDEALDRVAVVESYEFDVTNTAETSVVLDFGEAVDAPLLSVAGAAPGLTGESAVTISNDGTDDATLSLVVSDLRNLENGLVEPERAVDTSANVGELTDALELRVALVRADGSRSYLVGSGNALLSGPNYVPLSTLASGEPLGSAGLDAGEHAHLVVEWRLPADVGNEVQSDRVTFDVTLGLRTT